MTERTKPATWFWIVAVLGFLWDAAGCYNYIAAVTISEEALSALPDAERGLYEDLPLWATSAFAIAVWAGVLGTLLLLLRKAIAYQVLIISFIAIIIQMIYNIFISEMLDVYGAGGLVLPIVVIVIAAFLIWFAKTSKNRGWIS